MIPILLVFIINSVLEIDIVSDNNIINTNEHEALHANRGFEELEVNEISIHLSDTDESHLFLIVLEKGLYNAIGANLIDLWVDVILSEGNFTSIYVVEMNYASPGQIRQYFRDLYDNCDLEGAVLVGDIPSAEFEIVYNSPASGYQCVPFDYYYMDLSQGTAWQDLKYYNEDLGEWIMTPNGVFDTINWFALPMVDPEIFVGRISADGLSSYYSSSQGSIEREIVLIQRYIERMIEFRLDPPYIPHRAYAFIADLAMDRADMMETDISTLFPNSADRIFNTSNVNHNSYMDWLSYGCEWFIVSTHSNKTFHSWDYGVNTFSKNVTPGDFSQTYPKVRFYCINGCYCGNFISPNGLARSYLLNSDWTIGVVAQTGSAFGLPGYLGSGWFTPTHTHAIDFFDAVADGAMAGEALNEWQEYYHSGTYPWVPDELFTMIVVNYLGDPSVMPNMHY